jgi:hypothetical protein
MGNIFFNKQPVAKPRHNARTCEDLLCERKSCLPGSASYRKMINELRREARQKHGRRRPGKLHQLLAR